MSRNTFELTRSGSYYYNANGYSYKITRAEYQARRPPVLFVGYDARGNHGDSIRCNSCYLGHGHSAASHAEQIAEWIASKARFAAEQPHAYALWEAAQNDPNWD